MDIINIDWVEIPSGECVIGLSEEQKRHLFKQIVRQVGGLRKLFKDNRLEFRFAHALLLRTREQKRIYLDTFYISRYPITVEQYIAYQRQSGLLVDESAKCELQSGWGRLPEMATYDAATAFCRSLGIRLPTSDEWEKAARGPDAWLYPWGNEWDAARANVVRKVAQKLPKDRPPRGTYATEVDAFPAGQSTYGVMDLVGNIWEWTSTLREFPDRYGLSVLRRVKRRWPIKHSEKLAWLYNILAIEHPVDEHEYGSGFYTGFRVVCDDLSCITGHTR